MLVHIVPKLLSFPSNPDFELLDVTCPEFDLTLTVGKELRECRPYPNKNYRSACFFEARRAEVGVLLDVEGSIRMFSTITRWRVDGVGIIQHHVRRVLIDDEFDACTDSTILWKHRAPGFASRWPDQYVDLWPSAVSPYMEIRSRGLSKLAQDTQEDGIVRERKHILYVPTVEPERLQQARGSDFYDRLPLREHAIPVPARHAVA